MSRFEYEITFHESAELQNLEYFCSPDGECMQLRKAAIERCEFLKTLNQRGSHGWELVQLLPGADGFNALWKRAA
jgi:hypothetical protein